MLLWKVGLCIWGVLLLLFLLVLMLFIILVALTTWTTSMNIFCEWDFRDLHKLIVDIKNYIYIYCVWFFDLILFDFINIDEPKTEQFY